MRLSNIKGKRQIKVVGKLLELASSLQGDEAFDEFVSSIRGDGSGTAAMLKLGPVLLRDDIADGIIGVIAYAKDVSPEEVDNPVGEFIELISSDMEMPAFLSDPQ